MAAGHHHVGHFHRFRETEASMLVDFAAARLAAHHQFLEIAGLVVEQLDKRLVEYRTLRQALGHSAFEQLDDLVAARGTWTDHQCNKEAVDEHPLPVDAAEIGAVEIVRETRFERAAWILIDPHPDEMCPDRQPFVVKVAKKQVPQR